MMRSLNIGFEGADILSESKNFNREKSVNFIMTEGGKGEKAFFLQRKHKNACRTKRDWESLLMLKYKYAVSKEWKHFNESIR